MSWKSKFKCGLGASASALAITVGVAPIAAQAQAAPAAAANTTQVETIVVTASKRSESLQNSVGTITAFTAATLKTQGIKTLDDVSHLTPAMQFYIQNGAQFIILRGIGVPVDNGTADPNTAINVNGVNLPRSSEMTGNPYDLDRVEVASGPQGTLYGRNATGGAVNFILKAPTDQFAGEAGVGGGNYDSWDVHGMVSGPVNDKLRLLFSAYASGREQGYVKNLYNNTTFDRDRQFGVRGALSVDLASNVKLDVSVGTQWDRYEQYQQLMGGTINVPGGAGAGISAIPGLKYSLAPWTIYSAYTEPSYKLTSLANVTLSWDVTPRLHFKSITGASIFTSTNALDGIDVVPTPIILPVKTDGTPWGNNHLSNYYSQEFNLLGEFGHGGTWLVGAFASDETASAEIPVFLTSSFTTGNPDPLHPLDGMNIGIKYGFHFHEATQAVFGDATIPITSQFRIYGGLRYSHESNDSSHDDSTNIYVPSYPNLYLSIPDQCSANLSWNPLTSRAGFQYDFTEQIRGYFQYSQGFKDGGSNVTGCGNNFNPEYLTAYEVGVKSTLMDGRVVLNVSGYRYDYNGMQIYEGTGPGQSLEVNAGAQIYGLDAQFRARLTHDLTLDVEANYLDDYFTRFLSVDASDPDNIVGLPTVNVGGIPIPNLKGNSLPGVPDYNVTAGLQQNIPLSAGPFDHALVRLEGDFVGRLDISEWNRPQTIQQPFVKLNAIVELGGHGGWTVRLYGRNLTNVASSYHFLWSGGTNTWNGQYLPPRTFGIELTKTFGG